jgi:hypothetical protein
MTTNKSEKSKMYNRVLDKIKLSSEAWKALEEDMKNNMSKDYICRRFGIKPHYFKWLKRYMRGE